MPQVPPATLAQVPLVAAPPPGGAAPRKHRERVDSQRPSAKFIDTKARSQSETFPSRLPPAPAKVINEILDPVWRNWGDRTSVVEGKSLSVCVNLVGGRIIKTII